MQVSDGRVRIVEDSVATIVKDIDHMEGRLSKVENKSDVHDSKIGDTKTKLDLFYQEWKLYTDAQAIKKDDKKWGITQTLITLTLLVSLASIILAAIR